MLDLPQTHSNLKERLSGERFEDGLGKEGGGELRSVSPSERLGIRRGLSISDSFYGKRALASCSLEEDSETRLTEANLRCHSYGENNSKGVVLSRKGKERIKGGKRHPVKQRYKLGNHIWGNRVRRCNHLGTGTDIILSYLEIIEADAKDKEFLDRLLLFYFSNFIPMVAAHYEVIVSGTKLYLAFESLNGYVNVLNYFETNETEDDVLIQCVNDLCSLMGYIHDRGSIIPNLTVANIFVKADSRTRKLKLLVAPFFICSSLAEMRKTTKIQNCTDVGEIIKCLMVYKKSALNTNRLENSASAESVIDAYNSLLSSASKSFDSVSKNLSFTQEENQLLSESETLMLLSSLYLNLRLEKGDSRSIKRKISYWKAQMSDTPGKIFPKMSGFHLLGKDFLINASIDAHIVVASDEGPIDDMGRGVLRILEHAFSDPTGVPEFDLDILRLYFDKVKNQLKNDSAYGGSVALSNYSSKSAIKSPSNNRSKSPSAACQSSSDLSLCGVFNTQIDTFSGSKYDCLIANYTLHFQASLIAEYLPVIQCTHEATNRKLMISEVAVNNFQACIEYKKHDTSCTMEKFLRIVCHDVSNLDTMARHYEVIPIHNSRYVFVSFETADDYVSFPEFTKNHSLEEGQILEIAVGIVETALCITEVYQCALPPFSEHNIFIKPEESSGKIKFRLFPLLFKNAFDQRADSLSKMETYSDCTKFLEYVLGLLSPTEEACIGEESAAMEDVNEAIHLFEAPQRDKSMIEAFLGLPTFKGKIQTLQASKGRLEDEWERGFESVHKRVDNMIDLVSQNIVVNIPSPETFVHSAKLWACLKLAADIINDSSNLEGHLLLEASRFEEMVCVVNPSSVDSAKGSEVLDRVKVDTSSLEDLVKNSNPCVIQKQECCSLPQCPQPKPSLFRLGVFGAFKKMFFRSTPRKCEELHGGFKFVQSAEKVRNLLDAGVEEYESTIIASWIEPYKLHVMEKKSMFEGTIEILSSREGKISHMCEHFIKGSDILAFKLLFSHLCDVMTASVDGTSDGLFTWEHSVPSRTQHGGSVSLNDKPIGPLYNMDVSSEEEEDTLEEDTALRLSHGSLRM
eukprot:Nk52_evm7s2438 gene=Nk52_evmTU7s2438